MLMAPRSVQVTHWNFFLGQFWRTVAMGDLQSGQNLGQKSWAMHIVMHFSYKEKWADVWHIDSHPRFIQVMDLEGHNWKISKYNVLRMDNEREDTYVLCEQSPKRAEKRKTSRDK